MHSKVGYLKWVFQFSMGWFLASLYNLDWVEFFGDFYFFPPFKKGMEELENM